MAEGILFNLVDSIFRKIGALLAEEVVLLWGLQHKLGKLQHTFEIMRAVLLDAERQYQTIHEVRVWLDALKDVAYDADDLLDEISTETLRRKFKSGKSVTKKVPHFVSSSHGRLVYGRKVAQKIKNIRTKLDGIAANRKFHLNEHLVELVDHNRDTHSIPPNKFIGREDEKEDIISLLLADYKEDVVVLPIVGLGGLGKTTLAQIVYNDEKVCAQFDLRVWICVSDVFDIKSIVVKMIESIDRYRVNVNLEMETLKNLLFERVKGRKYLFVLDDIWNEDKEKWISLKDLFMVGARGSRVVLTTRSKIVAKVSGTLPPYQLEALSEIQSWNLFQNVAFREGRAPSEVLERLGKEITASLHGIPLAIKTTGSLLYTKTSESEWLYFKEEELLKLDTKLNINIVETLKLSYNYLPQHLKCCFAYCSLFPKDYKYDVYELVSHWKALGYADANMGEDGGLRCYKQLLGRSFFQEEEEEEEGYVVSLTCKMHDLMHDLATLVAGEEIKLIDVSYPETTIITRKTRHLSLLGGISSRLLVPLVQLKKARTLIIFPRELDDNQLCDIVHNLRYVRVLNLSRCAILKLPSSIECLEHLRELDLSWNREIKMLPNSITTLCNLELLNLDGCTSLMRLPKDMMNLVSLIHLGLESCSNLEGMPRGIGQLTSLQVLQQFNLFEKRELLEVAGGLDELHRLNKLSGRLNIFNLRHLKDGASECLEANLKSKPHIRFLKLDWGEEHQVEDIRPEEEDALENLQPHINLLKLALYYYGGGRFPSWFSSLKNLVEIEIRHCNNCKYLPPLDGLSSLQILTVSHLKKLEYLIDNSENTLRSCVLPKLRKLVLFYCPSMNGWWSIAPTTERSLHYQLPCLSELNINECPNLMALMPEFPSLEKLVIEYCDESESLQAWICNLSSLNHLEIYDCGRLSERCGSDEGEDWRLISHIPNIKIDGVMIQRESIYQF